MKKKTIPYTSVNYFSALIADYLTNNNSLHFLYNRLPKIDQFANQIAEKENNYNPNHRANLVNVLKQQYQKVKASPATLNHINSLQKATTFTITTGHQLNLFTGPLYFLYKIVSTINTCKILKEKFPAYNFVPVYWMATEDHDFEEINFFHFKEKKIKWSAQASGVVGKLATNGLDQVAKQFTNFLGPGNNAKQLQKLFEQAYLKHNFLADATRFLVNQLFGDYGLVILDADCIELKKQFVPYLKAEVKNQAAYTLVSKTNKKLQAKGYKVQVNPREINLFYLQDKNRERIILKNEKYHVLNTKISWSANQLNTVIENHPEQFSPNVILRPLYQEVILPNLCYIGGGGELAYWLQLQSYFKSQQVTFPMLLMRNSALIQSKKQTKKLKKLNLELTDLFLKPEQLVAKNTAKLSSVNMDFSAQKNHLGKQFKALYQIAKQTDASFLGAVAAQERKQKKGLENLEKRLLRAEKRKHAAQIQRIKNLQNELFPSGSLQERYANFSEFYLTYGDAFIPNLIQNLNPFQPEFTILEF